LGIRGRLRGVGARSRRQDEVGIILARRGQAVLCRMRAGSWGGAMGLVAKGIRRVARQRRRMGKSAALNRRCDALGSRWIERAGMRC
jgi:hypothetical protein